MADIPGYTLLRLLGQGAMAKVYLAVQQSLGREVALKVLSSTLTQEAHAGERFLREARLAANLDHPHIVPVFDIGTHEGVAYIAMQYESGGTVVPVAGEPRDSGDALRVVRDIALALDHAHAKGVVHRDIKPANILRRADGSCVLSDFGIARVIESKTGLTGEGISIGTPHYMSPEQLRGDKVDGRADLYSLGVVLYQLLTGELPYVGGDGWAIGMQHMSADIPRLPPTMAGIQPLLDGLLAKKASARPQTGAAVVRQVDALLSGAVATITVSLPAESPKVLSEKPSIAILPFSNLGDDPAQGYFSDGVTEDIITELSRWRMLAVRSRSASFRYRGPGFNMKRVARELNVRFIVEGSVRRMGTRIRITVQLIDTETGSHIWAEKFDRDAAEIFTVQDQVVQTVVSTLVGRVQVSGAEQARRKPPASLAAYEYVLRGNALSWDDPASETEATRLFERAIEIDPGYGFAHALLAVMRFRKWYGDPSAADDALNDAYALAKRAVELDENESTCFAILGQVCVLRRSWDLALQYMQRAVEINPNNQWNAADMGDVLMAAGRAEESLGWFKRARDIDPYFDPPWYWRSYGQALMALHRYEQALAMFEHSSVRHYRIVALMAACHARLGAMDQARACATECLELRPGFSIAHYMSKQRFRNAAEAAFVADSLGMAGLPMHSRAEAGDPAWVGEVIHFWFEDLSEAQWFAKNDGVDARIRERFLALYERLAADAGLPAPTPTPRRALATVIVLDQFARNMFRGNPRAYAADAMARRVSRSAIEREFDTGLNRQERMFLYMPFEHSEDAADQRLAVDLMGRLGDTEWTRYAEAHKAIIDRFGRFPHRNAALDRPSSAEEIEFLKETRPF